MGKGGKYIPSMSEKKITLFFLVSAEESKMEKEWLASIQIKIKAGQKDCV